MRNKKLKVTICLLLATLCFTARAQTFNHNASPIEPGDPWTAAQLLPASKLAADINAGNTKSTVVFNIGVMGDIKEAKNVGAASKAENLLKLKSEVSALPKSTLLVIYCGCCPFTKCPNIRPAFNQLKSEGFTNVKLLDLPTNLKTNWIDKKYPLKAK